MRDPITALGALAAVVLLGACTPRVADFTLLSAKNVELSRSAELVRGSERAEGRDEEATILIVSTGIPDVKEPSMPPSRRYRVRWRLPTG